MIERLKYLKNHKGFVRYFKNTSWLFFEKILRLVIGLFVGVWVARYLGPEQFGTFSYAQSFVGLFIAISTLGLDSIVVRELVNDESRKDELIGTAFWLKIIAAFWMLLILGIAINFTTNDLETNILVFIIASSTIFHSFNVIDFYFQSKVLSKYAVYANIISLLVSSIVKVALVLNEAPLIAFACVVLLDGSVLAIGYIYFYTQNNSIKTWKFDKKTAFFLIKESWYLIVSGISINFGMRIDQVFLKEILGFTSVGFYSAGVKIAEPLVFIPMVIAQSIFPKLIKMDNIKEKNHFIELFRVIFYSLFFISVIIMLFSTQIIEVLYGGNFNKSSIVLAVLIFTIPLTFLNILSSKILLKDGLQKIIMKRQIMLLLINLLSNFVLIPKYGILGAAVSTLVSDIFVSLILDKFNQKSKYLFYLKIDALFFTNYSK